MSTKGKTYPAEYLTRPEVKALLEACGDTWVGKRNRALIVIMWRAGLRVSEALSLRVIDVDWELQTIRILHGKGDKARTVAIDKDALAVIQDYLNSTKHEFKHNDTLIITRNGGPVKDVYVRSMLPRLAKKAGVYKRVHAHMFRHTFAVELAREGVPMPLIQRLLGHASLGTTSIYLASLSPEEALNAVRGREWNE